MPMPKIERGTDLITAERQRQIAEEGWTQEHDDRHAKSELLLAALSYAEFVAAKSFYPELGRNNHLPVDWPWGMEFWKPSDDLVRNLVKAGALIAAEIDRLKRKQILDAVFKPLE